MKIDRFAHYRTLTISSLLAAVLWCTACSFYSTAISYCTSVGIKWETSGVSPSGLIRQQTYARQDGAGNQPEVTLWQTYPEQEVMASDNQKMNVNGGLWRLWGYIILHADCRCLSGQIGCVWMCSQYRPGILLVGKYQRDWDAGKGGRKAVLCPRHI